MASTFSGSTDIVIERTRRSGARTKYHWPPIALNFWLLIMLIGSATILGVFADFIYVQNRLALGVPWYFTYWVTVASMMVVFILVCGIPPCCCLPDVSRRFERAVSLLVAALGQKLVLRYEKLYSQPPRE